jgi:hypothetical protein
MTEEMVDQWLEKLDNEHDEFTYRYIYSAYCRLRSVSGFGIDFEIIHLDHGGFILREKDCSDPTIELKINSEEERLFVLRYIEKRFCNERYASIDDWAEKQSQYHMEDRENWVYVPSGKKNETAYVSFQKNKETPYDPDAQKREAQLVIGVLLILTVCALLIMFL